MIIPPTAILEADWLSWPTDTRDLVLAQQVKNKQLTALSTEPGQPQGVMRGAMGQLIISIPERIHYISILQRSDCRAAGASEDIQAKTDHPSSA